VSMLWLERVHEWETSREWMPTWKRGTREGKGPTRDRPTGDRPAQRGAPHNNTKGERPTQETHRHIRHVAVSSRGPRQVADLYAYIYLSMAVSG